MSTFDPSGLDVNAIMRDALHQRGTLEDVEGPLSDAVARVVPPEAARAVHAALWGTVRRCAEEEGLAPGDALHSIVANLSRYRFVFEPEGPAWVARGGRLVRAGAEEPTATPPPAAAPAAGSGCLGMLALAATLGAGLLLVA